METTKTKQKNNPIRTLRILLIVAMIVFAIFACVFFGRALNVRTVYDNSTLFPKNAYVGGDAYNYIINGNYFAGYSETASGCMICAVMCGVGAAAIGGRKEKEKEKEVEAEKARDVEPETMAEPETIVKTEAKVGAGEKTEKEDQTGSKGI